MVRLTKRRFAATGEGRRSVEAFKLAFETIIVGGLALVWVAMVIYLFNPSQALSLLSTVTADKVSPVLSVVLFVAAYLLGSAVSRVAEDFFDDEGNPVAEYRIRTA